MPPALVGAIALGGLVGGFCVAWLILRGRQRGALERLAADQRTTVQLYLRRKAAETGVDIGDPNPGSGFEEVLASNVTMASALLEHERRQVELGDTQEVSLAATVRLQSTEEGAAPPPPLPPKPSS